MRPQSRQSAARSSGVTGSGVGRARDIGQARRQAGLSERGERGPPPEHEALEERVRGEPVRAVDACRSALAGRVETGELAATVEIGEDAADRVVRRWRDRDRRQRGVVALIDEAAHERGKALAVDRTQVERHRPARRDLSRDDVARSELVGEAVPLLVEQERALATQRLREQERGVDERGRVELDEFEVSERGARAIGGSHPFSDRARRVRRSLPQRGGAAGREQRGARGDRSTVREDADAAIAVVPDRHHPLALCDLDAWMCEDAFGELSRDAVSGRSATRVHDSTRAVAALEPEAVVEVDSELDEVADARGRLFRQHRDGAPAADAAARSKRVLGVELRAVVLAHGSRDPALREQARRREQRALGQDEHLALGGRAQRREEAGHARHRRRRARARSGVSLSVRSW